MQVYHRRAIETHWLAVSLILQIKSQEKEDFFHVVPPFKLSSLYQASNFSA